MRRITFPQLVAAGTAGAAAGTVVSSSPINGMVAAVHLNYGGTVTTQDVTIVSKSAPAMTLLAKADNASDGWYFPVQAQHLAGTGAALTEYGRAPVDDYVEVQLTQADPGDTLDVTILVEN